MGPKYTWKVKIAEGNKDIFEKRCTELKIRLKRYPYPLEDRYRVDCTEASIRKFEKLCDLVQKMPMVELQ